jgi:peptide/nickel transport system ATP-binding protein
LNLLKTLQTELGMSYLFITHDMAVVAYMADEVLVMRHGQQVEYGDIHTILHQPQQEYTKTLLASVL